MKILVIDDEKNIRRIVSDYLVNEGFDVVQAPDGMSGIEAVKNDFDLDLVLLDIRMPVMDGLETIKAIKAINDIPVIFLTALDDVTDEVRGLEIGADDYITKPFSYEILIARVKSCLRKNNKVKPDLVKIDGMQIDFGGRQVYIDGDSIHLTAKEFDMLEILMRNKNMVFDRNMLLDKVWGFEYFGSPRTVDTHIKTLRSKLGAYHYIVKTVRGMGYKVEMD